MSSISRYLAIFFIVVTLISVQSDRFSNRKSKRTLTYIPPGGVFQFIMGVGLPLVLNEESLIIGLVLKRGFDLPYNSSHFTHPNVENARKKRGLSRWDVYELIAHSSRLYGLGGKECILRTICEFAAIPIDKNAGILEELLHAVFTPSTTAEAPPSHADNIYHAAERIGRETERSCAFLFSECRDSYSKMFTRLRLR